MTPGARNERNERKWTFSRKCPKWSKTTWNRFVLILEVALRSLGQKIAPITLSQVYTNFGFIYWLCRARSFHLYLSCKNVFTPQNTCIHAQNYCPQTVPICIQKSGFIGPLLYTSYNSRSRGPRRPKLLRATSNINTNRFQVVLDHFGHFLENVHFCSFRSFRAPGVIWRSYFRPRAEFSSLSIT